jgi:phytoene desaturase
MKTVVIGAGFSGLSASAFLAKQGHEVVLLEKNAVAGGRARHYRADGFLFDMGPSWYWMPDVFERFFRQFGREVSDYYTLHRLDPGYRIYFGPGDSLDVPAGREALDELFERLEPGSSRSLAKFLQEAEYKYRVGMNEFVFKPGHSLMEFADWRVLRSLFRLQMLTSMAEYVDGLFKNEQLRQLLKFPVLFLGATPENTPAMYSLMNYADLVLGTWYPKGGMYKIVEGMVALNRELGVDIRLEHPVSEIVVPNGHATHVVTPHGEFTGDAVLAGADYHHVEQHLLPERCRQYDARYWDKRTMAPSSLLFYLGVNKRLKGLLHHNLFFDKDFARHAEEIYTHPCWPSEPLFYVCAPSVTDPSVAPEGCENLFVLIPVAPGLEDDEATREHYYSLVMERLEAITGQSVREHVVYKRSYAHRDFVSDYHAFKGNAYGLANTLRQTAILKPAMKSPKVSNLFYTGQLTVPGPGVPPSLISGEVVAGEISKFIHQTARK